MKFFFILVFCLKTIFIQGQKASNNLTKFSLEKNISKFNCTNSEIDCSGNGICNENGTECICNYGYLTFYKTQEEYLLNKPRCNYKGKLQIKALLYSIFLSFGSAYFYLGHSFIGTIQFLFFFFVLYNNTRLIVVISKTLVVKADVQILKLAFNLILFMVICMILSFFWYIFDIIMIYLNIYHDSNNSKMYSYLL